MSSAVLTERAGVALDTYVVDIAWSHDNRSLAVAGGEGAVVLVADVATKPRHRVLGEHGMGALKVTWHPNSQVLASSGQDGSVALWASGEDSAPRSEVPPLGAAAGAERSAPSLRAPARGAESGTHLVLGSFKRFRPGTAWTEHLAYSPDGKLLATATGKVLSLWDNAGELIHRFEPLAATIAGIGWDKVGNSLAAATQGAIHVFKNEPQFPSRKYAWSAACLTAAFSPNGKYLATGTQDGTVHFWNLSSGKDSQMRGYGTKVTLTEWSANSRYLATAAANEVVIWDFGGKGPEGSHPIELKGHTDRVTALAFQPGGAFLVSAGRDWRISLWQPGKETIATDAHLTSGEVTAIRWSPNGQQLAVGDSKGRLTFYDLASRATPTKSKR